MAGATGWLIASGLLLRYIIGWDNRAWRDGMKISVVMPVYNEKDNIGNTINEINYKIKSAHNIIIIYDFEEDNTLPPIRDLMVKQENIFLLKNLLLCYYY